MDNYEYSLIQLWEPIYTKKGPSTKTRIGNRPEKKKEVYILSSNSLKQFQILQQNYEDSSKKTQKYIQLNDSF